MSVIDFGHVPLSGTGSRLFRIKQRIGALLAAIGRVHERNKAYEQLSTLDAHLLRDIGLTQEDVRDAFEGRRSSVLFEPVRMPYDPR
jgi:uncharacterized protein YjiS (DUF1127 family)